MFKPLKFAPSAPNSKVFDPGTVPLDMDIFWRTEGDFLPPGKTLNQLTPDELRMLKLRYRFDPMRPGVYQGITGIINSRGQSAGSGRS